MSRTERRDEHQRSWKKEDAARRRQWRRRQRHAVKTTLSSTDKSYFDTANRDERRTEGWLTW